MDVNEVTLIGRLGRDPEANETKQGLSYCRLNVATGKKIKDKEFTEWHRVVAFGKTADFCKTYLKKGNVVYVKGHLKTDSYEKDGEKRYSTNVIAERVRVFGPRPATTEVEKHFGISAEEPGEETIDIPF